VKTALLARAALLSAVAIVLMAIGGTAASVRLTCAAAAGICVMLCACDGGPRYGLLSFATVAVLSAVLPLPRTAVGAFVLFFGWYGALFPTLCGIKSRILSRVIRTAAFNAALAAGLFLTYRLIETRPPALITVGAFAAGNIALIVFDKALEMIMLLYKQRFQKK